MREQRADTAGDEIGYHASVVTRDPRSSRTLRRRVLRELGPAACRIDSLGAHELRALRRVVLRDLERPTLAPLQQRAAERDEQAASVAPVHWIEIALIGEDDRPIPGEVYELELPDGRVRRGRLDSEGKARVDGIARAGACKVRFPALDQDAWSPL